MLPTKSNTADQGCSPVSSNCVIWQGPDLLCINLCNGDTISSVVFKLAQELCDLQTQLNLTSLDLKCLVDSCIACPEPEKTLSAVLGLLINKVCDIEDLLTAPGSSGNPYAEPVLTLPSCMQYTNAQGQTVTNLLHSNYTLTMATKVCQLNSSITNHTAQITNHETRIGLLESAEDSNLPLVTPNCVMAAVPTAMNSLLDELEGQFCLLRGVLGTNTALNTAVGQQCTSLSAANALSQPGVMATIPGWKTTVTTMADSFQNLWLTVCDLRAAVTAISLNTTAGDCSAFIMNFTVNANTARDTVTLFFVGNMVIPTGYTNCNQLGSKVTISDSTGKQYTNYVDLISASTNSNGVPFTITSAGLNTSLAYTVVVEGCINKSGQVCSKTATKTLSLPCSIVTGVSATLIG